MRKITFEQLDQEIKAGSDTSAIAEKYGLKGNTIQKYMRQLKTIDRIVQDTIRDNPTLCEEAKQLNRSEISIPEFQESRLIPTSWFGKSAISIQIIDGRVHIKGHNPQIEGTMSIVTGQFKDFVKDIVDLDPIISMQQYPISEVAESTPSKSEIVNEIHMQMRDQVEESSLEKPLKSFAKKKLVFFNCQTCNTQAYTVTEYDDVECRKCGSMIDISKTAKAKGVCPSCENWFSVQVVYGSIDHIPCKHCKSPIDLVWNKHDKIYTNISRSSRK